VRVWSSSIELEPHQIISQLVYGAGMRVWSSSIALDRPVY